MSDMDKKYKLMFSDAEVQESIVYELVSKFNIEPSILRAEIQGSGGILILRIKGEDANVKKALAYLAEKDVEFEGLGKHITRDKDRCFNCGSCVSVCPTKSFYFDKKTYEVHLKTETCVACGSCITSCSTKAVKLTL